MSEPVTQWDIPLTVDLGELVELYHRHARALTMHRHGIDVLTAEQVETHALAELATATALSRRVQAGRWIIAIEALAAGSTVERVRWALSLDEDELRAGIRGWANAQRRLQQIDADRHAEVLALLDRAEVVSHA